ncbi:MAG TPA: ATP-binding protein, partial [Vicinamibacterales bacterium]|nr:ATP-binding protein [Vicinamibacterales bacterium]
QVLLNLVLNACESMTANAVDERRLTVTTTAADGFVHIAISDRGVGLPDDQRAAVFEPFVTFREQGLGLGLAISRSIILAHGGQIMAENNPDRGATFTFRIPVRPAESAPEPRAVHPDHGSA